MKIVNNAVIILVMFFLNFNIHCKHKNNELNKSNSLIITDTRKALIVSIKFDGQGNYVQNSNSIYWDKLAGDSISYVLYDINSPFLKKNILIKKDFTPIKTNFSFSLKPNNNKFIIVVKTTNYASTFYEDSLVLNDKHILVNAYYIQHAQFNQILKCQYLLSNNDTIDLRESRIDNNNCLNNLPEKYMIDVLNRANFYWKESEKDSAKKYYLEYIKLIDDNKIDKKNIPNYIISRVHL